MTIAEIYETELVDLPKAVEAYQQAADWFQGEESSRYSLPYLWVDHVYEGAWQYLVCLCAMLSHQQGRSHKMETLGIDPSREQGVANSNIL